MFELLREWFDGWSTRRLNNEVRHSIGLPSRFNVGWDVQPKLTREQVTRASYSVAVFTAAWDGGWQHYRPVVQELVGRLGERLGIGFVDIDVEEDFAREIGLKNVPVIGFFRNGESVALHLGWHLDVPRMTELLLEDQDVPRLDLPAIRGGSVTSRTRV